MKKQFPNRTIFINDNLDVMRGLDDDQFDLVYFDPPYNSDEMYNVIFDDGTQDGFRDVWRLNDMDWSWLTVIGARWNKVDEVCRLARIVHGDMMMSYLCMMAVRLIETKRVMKPNGVLVLQCDDNANAYLRVILDAIFGRENFFGEIVWKRATGKNDVENKFGRIHDTLYVYALPGHKWNQQFHPRTESDVKKNYPYTDKNGRWGSRSLFAKGTTLHGSSGKPWRGIDPARIGRGSHWVIPNQAKEQMPELNQMATTQEKLDAIDAAGEIYWPKKEGGVPRFKKRPGFTRPVPLQNLWDDIPPVQGVGNDYRLWQTQKPIPLLERLILCFTDKDDYVLDPWCGCATGPVAAEINGRDWMGIDLSPRAFKEVYERLQREADKNALLDGGVLKDVVRRDDLPVLSKDTINPYCFKETLYGRQQGRCGLCAEYVTFRKMTIDHKVPVNRGGQDTEDNLELYCGNCNSIKGGRRTKEEALVRLKQLDPYAPVFRTERPRESWHEQH